MNKKDAFKHLCDFIETKNSRTTTQILNDFYKDRAMTRKKHLDFCAEHNIPIDVDAVVIKTRKLYNEMIDNAMISYD